MRRSAWRAWVGVALGAALTAFGVTTIADERTLPDPVGLVITASGDAMAPTIQPGDQVAATKPAGGPHRGDLVLVGNTSGIVRLGIGRVAAIAGDRVGTRGTHLVVNGHLLAEEYLIDPGVRRDGALAQDQRTVPPGTVVLAADNRYAGGQWLTAALPVARISGIVVSVRRDGRQVLRPTTAFTDAGLPGAPHPVADPAPARARSLLGAALLVPGIALLAAALVLVRRRTRRAPKQPATPQAPVSVG
jgi:signal peptidase I